jgi:hypothetical protein
MTTCELHPAVRCEHWIEVFRKADQQGRGIGGEAASWVGAIDRSGSQRLGAGGPHRRQR